MELVKRFRNG